MSATNVSPSEPLDAEEVQRRLTRLAELERQIQERSAELAWANERLVAELYDRNAVEANANLLERYDAVTGLPNRHAMQERLQRALVAHAAADEPAAVVVVGVDKLAEVRQALGYAAADHVARQIADRLRLAVRGSDFVGRVGDDEFALLLAHLSHAQDAEVVARKLFELLSAPFKVERQELRLEPAVGVAVFPQDGDSGDLLIGRAESAMRHADQHGTGLAQFFRPEIGKRAARRLTLEAELRAALERDQFRVFYQPRVELRTGKLVGAEALLRWQHPERGLLSPPEFLDVAEETGLIVPIGERVLRQACKDAVSWTPIARSKTGRGLSVAVNLSPREFRGKSLLKTVEEALHESGLVPSRLQVDLNESGLAHSLDDVDMAALDGLRALGVRVALDGFGSGSASLSLLRRLQVDCLKIDGQFVRNAPQDTRDAVIVAAIVSLGRRLGLHVVATGIETDLHRNTMKTLGCHEAQGYLFGAAMSNSDFEASRHSNARKRRLMSGPPTQAAQRY